MIGSRGTVLCATAIGVASGAAYARWRRPRQNCCGATEIERAASLPGDELIPDATARNTRAISILAPPDAVWPWLAQMGADRGGFYSYDLLEDLFGLGIHSADVVVDAWQDVHVGDVVYADRRQGGGWYVDEVRPGVALVLQLADLRRGRPVRRTDPAGWEFVWAFVLIDRGDGSTRVLVRESVVFGRRVVRLLMAPVGLVISVMTHRMLLGIKERAELGEAARARGALTSAS
jgi:hypothetical protein